MMERLPRGVYTKEFREEAAKLVVEGGISIPEAGRRLSLAPSTLAYWVKAYKSGKLQEVEIIPKPLPVFGMAGCRYRPFFKNGSILFSNIGWNHLHKQLTPRGTNIHD